MKFLPAASCEKTELISSPSGEGTPFTLPLPLPVSLPLPLPFTPFWPAGEPCGFRFPVGTSAPMESARALWSSCSSSPLIPLPDPVSLLSGPLGVRRSSSPEDSSPPESMPSLSDELDCGLNSASSCIISSPDSELASASPRNFLGAPSSLDDALRGPPLHLGLGARAFSLLGAIESARLLTFRFSMTRLFRSMRSFRSLSYGVRPSSSDSDPMLILLPTGHHERRPLSQKGMAADEGCVAP
mmetsp:Transcript_15845/g.49794  ORF Transcript_15845/g.49794 Transcript_15845/m.49794 type:complete len:242 (-) Transcript_15845:1009-1734(-)